MSDNSFLHKDEQDESQLKKTKFSDIKSLWFLFGYARPYKGALFLVLCLFSLSSWLMTKSSLFMGDLVEKSLIPKNLDMGLKIASFILALEALSIVIDWLGGKILVNRASKVILDIREELFKKANNLPMAFYDRQPQGRIVTRMTHDIEGLENFFVGSLSKITRSLLIIAISFYAIVKTNFTVGIMIVLSIAPVFIFIILTRKKLKSINRNMSKASSAINSKLSEYLDGMEVIRSFGLESWSSRNYNKSVQNHLNTTLDANFHYAWTTPTITFLIYFPFFILIWFGGEKVIEGTISVGIFVALMRYCERFFNPVMTLAREVQMIQQALTNGERVASFLKHDEENKALGTNGLLKNSLRGKIEFRNVSMSYGKGEVLKNLSFVINEGEQIGLVGKTGCGKTSTVSLLSRLYEFQKGEILLDGIPIRLFDRNHLRKNIGFVSQDVIIFRDTLRNNLLMDQKQISEQEIWEACKLTGLNQVLLKQDMGLDALLNEGGSNLSLGERQVLAFTRVVLSNPRILILDEATANIDPKSEKLIQNCVEKVLKGRTCLIVAHRLNTLKNCDRIFVFEEGHLVEQGSTEELMEKESYFFQLKTDYSSLKTD